MKKIIVVILSAMILIGSLSSPATAAPANGWVKTGSSWYYYQNGKAQTGWQKVGSQWYYMNSKGVMQTGWLKYKNKWYFLKTGNSGRMLTGWQKLSNKWYYMDASGARKSGWLLWKNEWYYLGSDGVMYSAKWLKYKNDWYYLKESGIMAKGNTKISGMTQRFDSGGVWKGKENPTEQRTDAKNTTEDKSKKTTVKNGTKATAYKNLSAQEVVKKAGPLFTADQKKSGILASVSMAQFIIETGYGKSELAQKANNLFGMKCNLSGNTWKNSSWNGKSKYTIVTGEQNKNGSYYDITADFRKYSCIEDSIADHSAYLLGAMNGDVKRYAGIKGCKDYKKAVKIIAKGGYATSLTYEDALISIIESWDLTKYDVK